MLPGKKIISVSNILLLAGYAFMMICSVVKLVVKDNGAVNAFALTAPLYE